MITHLKKSIVIDIRVTKAPCILFSKMTACWSVQIPEHKQFVIPVLGSPDKVGYSDDHDVWFVVEEYDLRATINNM